MFQRGPDKIPRGNGLLMLRTVFLDARQQIYDNLCKLVGTPKGAHAFLMDYTDRTEGKAKQVVEQHVKRSTTFAPAPAEPPSSRADAADEAATHTVEPDSDGMIPL